MASASTQLTLIFPHSFTHAHVYCGWQALEALGREIVCSDWMS